MTLIGYANISLEDKIHQLEQVMPAEAISIIEEILQDVSAGRSQALLSFGMLATLWAASKGVNAIIKGLNRAYDIDESRAFWKNTGHRPARYLDDRSRRSAQYSAARPWYLAQNPGLPAH
ncbi:YihY/virulence factor BrkB family protein [Paenibacillus rhizoplanae]